MGPELDQGTFDMYITDTVEFENNLTFRHSRFLSQRLTLITLNP